MDRLQSMTTFVAVVDSGGFASAARKLNLSPPVVTRAVAELEEQLAARTGALFAPGGLLDDPGVSPGV